MFRLKKMLRSLYVCLFIVSKYHDKTVVVVVVVIAAAAAAAAVGGGGGGVATDYVYSLWGSCFIVDTIDNVLISFSTTFFSPSSFSLFLLLMFVVMLEM